MYRPSTTAAPVQSGGGMDPYITGSLIGAGASFIGGSMANAGNAASSRANRQFQAYMAATAHQREVADLKKAGLNPILSANSGAATPSGGQAQHTDVLTPAVSSAMQYARLRQDRAQSEAQIEATKAQAIQATAAARREASTARQVELQSKALEAQLPTLLKQNQWDLKTMDYRNVNQLLQEGLGTLNTGKSLLTPSIKIPDWIGTGKDGTKYHKQTGEILQRR